MKTKLHYLVACSFALSFAAPKAKAQAPTSNSPILIQFWDFNNTLPAAGAGGDSLGNATNTLTANYMATSLTAGHIIYSRPKIEQIGSIHVDSIFDNGSGGAFIYDYSSSNYNYFTTSDSAGVNAYVRARNPCDSSAVLVYIPTTGYKNIKLQYAISASSVKGATYNVLSYSTNGGNSWNKLTTAMDTFNIGGVYRPDTLQMINPVTVNSGWYPVQIDFSTDATVNDNAGFIVRMMLTGTSSLGSSGNDRYDNFAVWGTSTTTSVNEIATQSAGYNVYPNPATSSVNVTSDNYTGAKVVTLYNVVGQTISTTENYDKQTTINTSALNSGIYFVEIREVNTGNRYTVKVVKE